MKKDRWKTVRGLIVPGAPFFPPSLKTLRFYRLTDRVSTIATPLCYTISTTISGQALGNAQENGRAAATQSVYTIVPIWSGGVVASTTFSQHHETVEKSGFPGRILRPCDTTVRHTVTSEPSSNRCSVRLSASWACDTTLYHNTVDDAVAAWGRKPSQNGSSGPWEKRSASRPRRTSGLMVRGTVFYLRVRVPRHIQASVGR